MAVSSIVNIAGQSVFGLIAADPHGVRLQLMTQEWANLCLAEGQTVRVNWPGQSASNWLIVLVKQTELNRTSIHFIQPILARR